MADSEWPTTWGPRFTGDIFNQDRLNHRLRSFRGELYPESKDERLFRLSWAVYHFVTERYDRGLPHTVSPFSGDALPDPGGPMRQSSLHAKSRMKWHQLNTDLLRKRLGTDRVRRIKSGFDRMKFEGLKRMVEDVQGEDAEWVEHLTNMPGPTSFGPISL